MLTLGVATGLGKLVGLGPIDATPGREEEDPVVGRRDEEVLDHIVLAQGSALDSSTTTALLPVEIGLGALGVAA